MHIILNAKWRVAHDERPKPYTSWELQHLKSGRWQPRSFCQTKHGLISAIKSKAGACNPDALALVQALPDNTHQGQ